MLYSEIIAVCSQIHTKHINTLCGQNVELLGELAKVAKSDYELNHVCPSVWLSACMLQLCYLWTDFHLI